MVTNRHVAEDAQDRIDINFLRGEDREGQIRRPILGDPAVLKISEPLPVFHFHPDQTVDVAVLPLGGFVEKLEAAVGLTMYTMVGTEQAMTDGIAEELETLEQVIVLGYPDGLYDTKHLTPIARTGHTASPIQLDYQGAPTFLIDAPIFPGSSGSPVFLVERMGKVAGAFGATGRVVFLGIVAEAHVLRGSLKKGKRPTAAHLMNLGIVYKPSTIDECVDAAMSSEGFRRIETPPGAIR